MGRVVEAEDTLLDRKVALKVILRLGDEDAKARFFREAKIAAKLTHPNLVRLYDIGTADDVPFLVMELIEGSSLVAFVGDIQIPFERKVKWLIGAARGLQAAHDQGLIHRDIKPGNIMVAKGDDTVKVVDFGLAKQMESSPKMKALFSTHPAYVVGTAPFMAPEQILGFAKLDGRADQFAWGVTGYALLSGQHARANDPNAQVPPLDKAHGVPKEIACVIARAIRFHRDDRYPSLEEAAADLEAAIKVVGVAAATAVDAPAPSPTTHVLLALGSHERVQIDPGGGGAGRGSRLSVEPAHPAANQGTPPLAPGPAAPVPAPAPRDSVAATRDRESFEIGWKIKRQVVTCGIAPIRAAVVAPDGRTAYAISQSGLAKYSGGRSTWEVLTLPGWFDPSRARCLGFMPDGNSLVIGGVAGLALRMWVDHVGAVDRWPMPDKKAADVTLLAMTTHKEDVHFVGAVGDEMFGTGVFHRVTISDPLYPTTIHHEHPLHAVVRVPRGVIGCGPAGWVCVLVETGAMRWIRPHADDLHAIGELSGDIYLVGRGYGVRLHAPDLVRTTFESVATTTTLRLMTVQGGDAWSCTDGGRILRRDSRVGGWKVMHAEPTPLPFAALHLDDQRLTAIGRDGSVLSGTPDRR
jgi:hypothetical protein